MQAPPTETGQPGSSRTAGGSLRQVEQSPSSRRQGWRPQYGKPNGAARGDQLTKALGWFSIGLGVAQLLAPRAMSRASGMAYHPVLMRAVGVREITAGVGILSQRKPANWLW